MRFTVFLIAISAALMGMTASAAAQTQAARGLIEAAPETAWRTLDPENTLYMDLPSGRIVIELRPDFAPQHVERIKTLSRQGFYDGIIFHRVIEGFMAQGGDPTGTGTGGSPLPNIPAEFMRSAAEVSGVNHIGRDSRAAQVGFIGPIPVGTQPDTLRFFLAGERQLPLWGMHCAGVMSMARANDPNSANSQFFLMFGDSRDGLDQRYTIWGRVVDGFENARRINRGEPPARPTPIKQMRVAADVPQSERDDVQVLRTDDAVFAEYLKANGDITENGYIEDVCNVTVPSKINGEIEL